MIAGVIIVGPAFVWSYVGALHEPTFHGVPFAVVGSPRLQEPGRGRAELDDRVSRTRSPATHSHRARGVRQDPGTGAAGAPTDADRQPSATTSSAV
jgi:hypothetical protein